MKNFRWTASLLLLLSLAACKKETESKPAEETGTKFPTPTWTVDESGRYPATMTAAVVLPTALQPGVSETDQLAAFIGEECRGLGVPVKVGTTSVYFLMIRGKSDEQSNIRFKYYSAKTAYLYQSAATLKFLIDDVYGTAQNPKVLELTQVK